MPLDPRRVKALFNAVLDLPDTAERPAFLDRECGSDQELRQRLGELLAAYDQPASALAEPLAADPEGPTLPEGEPAAGGAASAAPTVDVEPPAAGLDRTVTARREGAAPQIGGLVAGRYKLRQEIGEGGMGSVYLAEQMQPVKRQVALKLIKAGMDSRAVLARFESERQALALMDHPNIAKVLDAGTTEDGRPFFVMELVKGIPLTDYCDRHRLGLPERLAVFRQVCSAVQHAHQKGIIHRDLKPTNILVESHDGLPVPKVIDFGLAKATSGLQLSEHSLYSAFGAVAGTPLYMAPEQATFNAVDIDTRADIYSLGVILYELLTGTTPIRRETLKRAAIDEMLRMVREVEPPTPSSRISSSDTLPSIAATRHIEPARLSRFVRGDLDWIVLKALSKERQRRYESPLALAHDIERFLNHEPVSAGPPTASYRLRKFVRRNRPQVIAASLVLLAMVVGIVGTTLGLIEADRQRRVAITQRRTAEKRLAQVVKANDVLGSVFQDLNPRSAEKEGKPLSELLGERLDHATAQIEGDAIGDPLTVAQMQETLGVSQLGLGYAEKAITLLAKARGTLTAQLGPDDPRTLICTGNLATAYLLAGELDRALPLYEGVLALKKAKLGSDHPETLTSMDNLATAYRSDGQLDRALRLSEETVAKWTAEQGRGRPATLIAMHNLALIYRDVGRLDRAVSLLEETLALQKAETGRDHPDTLATMDSLALTYQAAGKLDRALPLFEETLALRKAKLGRDHPDTLASMGSLAVGYLAIGRLDLASPLLDETLTLRKAKLGSGHPETILSMNDLANGYRVAGKLDRALPLFEETFALIKAKRGPGHPETLAAMNNVALVYQEAGRLDRAVPLFEEALRLQRAKHGRDHPDTLSGMHNLAGAYRDAGQPDRAMPLYEETLARRKAKLGADHPHTLISMNGLANVYREAGRLDKALPLLEETLALRKAKLGADHPDTITSMNSLANGYHAAGKLDRALPLYEETLALRKAKLGADHPDTITSMGNLAGAYRSIGRPDRALSLYQEALPLARAKLGADHPLSLAILADLASSYREAGQLDRALPLYEEVLALRRAKLGADHPDTLRSMNGLAAGYWATGRFDRSVPILEEVLRLRTAKSGADHPDTWQVRANLGVNYKDAGRLREALPLLEAAALASREIPSLRWVKDQLLNAYVRAGQADKAAALIKELLAEGRAAAPPGSPQLAGLLARAGAGLLDVKAWDEAEPIVRECLALREKAEPDAWTTFNTRSMLGAALLGQKKYAEAEPLLRAGYEGMKRRSGTIPPQAKARLGESAQRLIQLYDAWDRPDQAAEWRERLKADLPQSADLTLPADPFARR